MEPTSRRVGARLLLVANLAAATLAAATTVVAVVRHAIDADATALGRLGGALEQWLGSTWTWSAGCGAAALLLCDFAWLVRRSPQQPERTYILSTTPTGPVRVSREALESGLRVAGEALPEITRLRIAVDCSQPKRVLVRGTFQCADGANNLSASQRLRQALRDRFDEMVHLADGVRAEFDLEFQGFLGKLAKKVQEQKGALDPEPPPFTGPQYPIDDDEAGGR